MKIEINNGVVTNDGEELGIIQDGTCHLTMQCAPIIKGEIRKVAGNLELKFLVGEAPDTEDATSATASIEGSNGPGPGPQGAPPPVASTPADPMPARDPLKGDKCPNLIAWKARQKGGK